MSNTDSLYIPNSGSLKYGRGITLPHHTGITALKDLMVGAGWTLVETTKAAGFVEASGWFNAYRPTYFNDHGATYVTENDSGDFCNDCFPGSGGITSFGNNDDPNECRRGFNNLFVQCDGVTPWPAWGCDGDGHLLPGTGLPHGGWFTGTFHDFAQAVVGCSPNYFSSETGLRRDGTTVVLSNGHSVYIEALVAGPEWNAPGYNTELGVGLSSGPAYGVSGGGYRLRSLSANGKTQYEVVICMYRAANDFLGNAGGGIPGNMSDGLMLGQFAIRVKELYTGDDTEVEYILAPGTYEAIVNPYMLFLRDGGDADVYMKPFALGGNSFLAVAPYCTDPSLDYNLLVIGPGNILTSAVWTAGVCSFAINGGFETFQAGIRLIDGSYLTTYPGLCCLNFPVNGPILSTNGRPIAQSPWLMAPKNGATEATIVGMLWDSFAGSQAFAQRSKLSIRFIDYTRISGQTTAPECSLFLAAGNYLGTIYAN